MITGSHDDQAAVPAEATGARDASAADGGICYRMDPVKRMLPQGGCLPTCQGDGHGNGHGGPSSMPPCLMSEQAHTVIDLEPVRRVALMVTPQARGEVIDQVWEAVSTIRAILRQQSAAMTVTAQTVFLRRAEDAQICRSLFRAYFGERMPATTFVVQPPCGGQALAIEAWALGGEGVDLQFLQPDVVCVAYDGLRWIHIGGVTASPSAVSAYAQSRQAFEETAWRLEQAGGSFRDVVRLWLYLGGITETEESVERYRELNRARTDFFHEQETRGQMIVQRDGNSHYPASTGIGTAGREFTLSCLALQTNRTDVLLRPLENPRQTSAFRYAQEFSPQSPKFSRAMAVVIGDYVTTWISGTASIVNSESVHLGDVERQTEQTIDNICDLIGPENFARHGIPGGGARLSDLAKVRVYVKHAEDVGTCRAVCERRFGRLPTIYAEADVCRSNLLVEIEGVAFSPLHRPGGRAQGVGS